MSDLLHEMIQQSHANVLGGNDFYDATGHHVGHSTENIMGGHEIYDGVGHHVGHTADNIFGGHDLFDATGVKVASTSHGVMGETYHDAIGNVTGYSTHHGDTVTHMDLSGHHATWHKNLFGGFTADPLTNMSALKFPSFIG